VRHYRCGDKIAPALGNPSTLTMAEMPATRWRNNAGIGAGGDCRSDRAWSVHGPPGSLHDKPTNNFVIIWRYIPNLYLDTPRSQCGNTPFDISPCQLDSRDRLGVVDGR
jgi:hypothetical protein